MHELAITENLLNIALQHANAANAKHIRALYLVIGQWSSIVDDSVQFYWDIISQDTIAEKAHLHFQRIPTLLQCLSCETEFAPNDHNLACTNCQGNAIKIIAGEEFFLESIDIE